MNPTCWSRVQGGRSVRNKIILPQSRRKAGELGPGRLGNWGAGIPKAGAQEDWLRLSRRGGTPRSPPVHVCSPPGMVRFSPSL